MKKPLLFTFLFLSTSFLFGQVTATFVQEIDVKFTGELTYFELTGYLPQTIMDKQRLIHTEFYPKETKSYIKNDVKYYNLIFSNKSTKDLKIVIKYDLELFDYDFDSKGKRDANLVDTTNLERYLDSEFYQKINSKKILSTANKIKGTSKLEIAKNIFDFVIDTLKYDNTVTENIGAAKALKKGRGDCTEYSDLFVTLARAKGIPARVLVGKGKGRSKNPNHNWVEVFIKEKGWIPIDPSAADNPSSNVNFENTPNRYVIFAHERSDNVLGSNTWKYKWRGKFTAPISITSNYFTNGDLEFDRLRAFDYYNSHNYDSALIFINQVLAKDEENAIVIALKAIIFARLGEFESAKILFQLALPLAKHRYQKRDVYYSFANYFGILGDVENTLSYLEAAFQYGFSNFSFLEKDEDLQNVINDQKVVDLINNYKDKANLN